jgi:hypothetical protein
MTDSNITRDLDKYRSKYDYYVQQFHGGGKIKKQKKHVEEKKLIYSYDDYEKENKDTRIFYINKTDYNDVIKSLENKELYNYFADYCIKSLEILYDILFNNFNNNKVKVNNLAFYNSAKEDVIYTILSFIVICELILTNKKMQEIKKLKVRLLNEILFSHDYGNYDKYIEKLKSNNLIVNENMNVILTKFVHSKIFIIFIIFIRITYGFNLKYMEKDEINYVIYNTECKDEMKKYYEKYDSNKETLQKSLKVIDELILLQKGVIENTPLFRSKITMISFPKSDNMKKNSKRLHIKIPSSKYLKFMIYLSETTDLKTLLNSKPSQSVVDTWVAEKLNQLDFYGNETKSNELIDTNKCKINNIDNDNVPKNDIVTEKIYENI